MKTRWLSACVIGVVLILSVVSGATSSFLLHLDFNNPEHIGLIEQPLDNWPVSVAEDPFGKPALFFPQGSAAMAPPADTYQHMRFALLNVRDVHDFVLSVDSIGVGGGSTGGNRSLALVFGYEDIQNWWVAYFTYTDTTRVARIVDGQQEYVCRPGIEGAWTPYNGEYQNATLSLMTEGNNMVLRAWVNGIPAPIDLCTFPAREYRGGKVGFGGHSTSTAQSWFLNNVRLEVLGISR